MSEVLWRLGAPIPLAAISMWLLAVMDVVAADGWVFVVCYLIWLVIINGGILILDGDDLW